MSGHPYRDARNEKPPSTWFGRWMCRRGWHTYRYLHDKSESEGRKRVVVHGSQMAFYWLVPTVFECARCGYKFEIDRLEPRQ